MIPLFDLGLPNDPNAPVYGLWEPVTERFIFVIDDAELALTLRLIGSARYTLFVTEISRATNYHPTIIDNTCCADWTLANRQDIVSSMPAQQTAIVPVAELIQAGSAADWDMDIEMQYFQICAWWLRFTQSNRKLPWYEFDRFIDRLYPQETFDRDHNLFDSIYDLETHVMKNLHASRTNDSLWQACVQAVHDSHPLLQQRYHMHYENQIKASQCLG